MGRSYLKVYFDFNERTEGLNEIEKGRLLLGMLEYAQTGAKPDFKGNERFCFSSFKVDIDRDCEVYNSKVSNGSKGGRPIKPNKTENNRNKPNESEITETAKNKKKNKNQEKEKENIGDITPYIPLGFDTFWQQYPRHTAKEAARKAWAKLNPSEELQEQIIAAVLAYKASPQWTKDGGQFIPHPSTFLNQRRWEDEIAGSSEDYYRQLYAQFAEEEANE